MCLIPMRTCYPLNTFSTTKDKPNAAGAAAYFSPFTTTETEETLAVRSPCTFTSSMCYESRKVKSFSKDFPILFKPK